MSLKKINVILGLSIFFCLPMQQINIKAATDISGHWAETTIEKWLDADLIKGYEDGSFKPNDPVTRAEFVYMVNNSLQFRATGEIDFTDVLEEDWFYKGVSIAVTEGYANGLGDGTFDPNGLVTRAQAAVFGYNAAGRPTGGSINNFTDTFVIPSWAANAIACMNHKGYLSGVGDGTFDPNRSMTRAEAVSFLERIRNDIIK